MEIKPRHREWMAAELISLQCDWLNNKFPNTREGKEKHQIARRYVKFVELLISAAASEGFKRSCKTATMINRAYDTQKLHPPLSPEAKSRIWRAIERRIAP